MYICVCVHVQGHNSELSGQETDWDFLVLLKYDDHHKKKNKEENMEFNFTIDSLVKHQSYSVLELYVPSWANKLFQRCGNRSA